MQFWKFNINKIHIYEAVFLNPRKYNILKIYGHSGYQTMFDERKGRKHRVRKRKRKTKDRREGGRAREENRQNSLFSVFKSTTKPTIILKNQSKI